MQNVTKKAEKGVNEEVVIFFFLIVLEQDFIEMGICPSALSEDERLALKSSKFWEAQLDRAKAEDRSLIKLLLLGMRSQEMLSPMCYQKLFFIKTVEGTGESGKSTIFKQMQILYDSGFGELEVIIVVF